MQEEAIKEHMTNLQKSFDSEQRRNPNRPFYFLKKKQMIDIMLAAMKRTGRYKQLASRRSFRKILYDGFQNTYQNHHLYLGRRKRN